MRRSIRRRIPLAFAAINTLVVFTLGAILITRVRTFLVHDLPIEPSVRELLIADLWRVTLVSIVIAAVLAAVVVFWIARGLVSRLGELTEAARRIAGGEMLEKPFLVSRDEVGDLGRALNQMSDRLRGQIEALNAEREKLSAVLQQMDSGVVMVDPGGRMALINRAAERIFGISEARAIGTSLVETLRLYQVVDLWEKARRENAPHSATLDLLNRGQSLQVIASPLGGVLHGSILLIFQDMTRVRQLETIRRDFVSNLSHELRTPLASLKALTETLLDGALDDPPAARRFLNRFETEVDSLSLMVQELLELTRIESGQVPLEFEPVEPGELIRGAVERLYLQAERAGLQIDVERAEGLPPVLVDPPRMQQVLMNLLHNAIKFTPVGGRITLAAEPEAGGVVFRIRDTGVGIPVEDLPRIFERFYKADRARSGGGTGLGLAISKHLVEAHGGRIWAESAPGEGSTFFFYLPARSITSGE
ncbi:MAG TPA: ATP-binding protein [Anaerolineales bacterium]|nr:ATP-binding protein [Anaerolineales bacterium]